MAPPSSYAKAAWANGDAAQQQQQQQPKSKQDRLKKLLQPPPASFALKAAVLLLHDFAEGQTVYLMDRNYMQNWLIWCIHQRAPVPGETTRLHESVRMAALQLHLTLPAVGMSYSDPGPVDNSTLSIAGHPLLLDATVQVYEAAETDSMDHTTVMNGSPRGYFASRTRSLGTNITKHQSSLRNMDRSLRNVDRVRSTPHQQQQQLQDAADSLVQQKYCVAVSERFYELLRSVHGVICDDFETVSFQPAVETERSVLLLHHRYYSHNDDHSTAATTADEEDDGAQPRPIEFRRKVVLHVTEKPKEMDTKGAPAVSLMERLMLEEQIVTPQLVVEVHPIKLLYSCMTSDAKDTTTAAAAVQNGSANTKLNGGTAVVAAAVAKRQIRGFVLVSRDAPAFAAVTALQRVAAPNKASQSVRLWSRWDYAASLSSSSKPPTAAYDGYELVDLDLLSNDLQSPLLLLPTDHMNGGHYTTTAAVPRLLTTGSWVEQHHAAADVKELELLVETRRTVNAPWPRIALELEQRLQPGDLVDAQDVAGKWYEAVVRQVDNDTVLVHYAGWASKWDSKARRRKPVPNGDSSSPPPSPAGVPSKVKAPAPLWSQSGRWRERLVPGDAVEVRDSSSIVERPKWYCGIVKRVGGPNDAPRPLRGGANLETYAMKEGDEKKPLQILGRTQQILVEVEQERSDKASIARNNSSPTTQSSDVKPHPPYLRWVDLFGEEICKAGTHLKEAQEEGPVTLRYEFDNSRKPVEVMKSHPMLGAGFMRESLRGTPPAPGSAGLHNLGNSCFLNSTVQCLNHIEPLTQFFLQDKYSKDLNKRNPLGSGGNVAVAYASLLKKMWAGNHSVLVPRLLKQTVANFAPQFDNSYQHDSHEFCQFLMDGLHEDLNRVKKKPYVEELEGFGMEDQKAAIESWRKHLLRHDSIIVDHCQAMHRSHLTCPQCGRESIKFDVYSSISLPLPTEKHQTTIKLEDCIEKFMEAEQLDERDAYYCPNCRRHVCALKLIALWSVPDILILHLKRFTFDTCMLSGGMLRSKVDNTVDFPINGLDLTKQVLGPIDPEAPPIYNLFGVSEHSGPTANSGHYTATIRNSVDGQWYRCNDSHVGLTSGEASITGGAYLLFYQRAKGITKWGGMHKVMKELGIDPYGGMEPIDKEGFRQVSTKKKKKG
jgi:ubiquitin carboxyl-terminal hydrolase 8